MNFYTYMIASREPSLKTYVGWTTNLKSRLNKHNSGKGAKATRGRKWVFVYYKKFNTRNDAMKNEYKLKKNKIFRMKIKKKFISDDK